MRCLRPWTRTYINAAGVKRSAVVPCGKCIACLHNQQDSWSIRLRETSSAYRSFIYDTLTIAPKNLEYIDVTDVVEDLDYEFSDESMKLIRKYSRLNPHTCLPEWRIPWVEKSSVQNWIKRGRELYFKRTGKRLKFKYFIVMELGPKFSRPHFHCLFFGIPRQVYVQYFQKPWKLDYGFTKTCFIESGTDKDRDCLTKYVSKYVSKGVFESPLVKDGFIPRPWRLISKGIGEEYLNKPGFRNFFTEQSMLYKSVSVNLKADDASRTSYLRYAVSHNILGTVPEPRNLSLLKTYYDSSGFPHGLPRYYRNKLLKLDAPNYYSLAIQNYLLEDSRVQLNKNLLLFAEGEGYKVDYYKAESPTAGLDIGLYDLLLRRYYLRQKDAAKDAAESRYKRLKNHYGRQFNLSTSIY